MGIDERDEMLRLEAVKNHVSVIGTSTRIPAAGYVYLIQPVGHNVYKIGSSVDVPRRLRQLQRKRQFDLQLLYTVYSKDYERLEQELHQRFESYRLADEWFLLPPEAIEYIKGLGS